MPKTPKTIVSIISAQPTPNYLLIREIFQPGDDLLFITSKTMENKIDFIAKTLNWVNAPISKVILPKGAEEKWNSMCKSVEKALSHDKQYAVNLTGGTKYMALAIHSVFSSYHSTFYYIPYPRNVMLVGNKEKPIETRLTVEEYMSIHGHTIKCGRPFHSSQGAEAFLKHFCSGHIDYETINKLRAYRDKNIIIKNIEEKEDEEKKPRIPNLQVFIDSLNGVDFVPATQGRLSKAECQYLTGGWFEEYVYYLIQKEVQPTDLQLGVKIASTNNDLDVVFTAGNKLFVIECKTGIGNESMLNQIAYKAAALKEYIKGLSANSYIYALAQESESWDSIPSAMGIHYYGRDWFVKEEKREQLIADLKKHI